MYICVHACVYVCMYECKYHQNKNSGKASFCPTPPPLGLQIAWNFSTGEY